MDLSILSSISDHDRAPLAAKDRSWRKPHWVWSVPVCFFARCLLFGTNPEFAQLARTMFPQNSSWALNLPNIAVGALAFFTVPIAGMLSDRFGRKPVFLVCSTVYALPFIALYVGRLYTEASSYLWYLVLTGSAGLTGSFTVLLCLCFSYIADCTEPEARPRAAGIFGALAGIADITTPSLYSWAFAEGEAPARFSLCLAVTAALMVVSAAMLPESRARDPSTARRCANPLQSFRLLTSAGSAETRAMLRILFAVFLIVYTAKIGVLQNVAIFAQGSLGLTTTMASFLTTCYGISQFFGQLLVGPLSRALSQRLLIVLYIFCCLVACAVPAVPGMPSFGLFVAEAFLGVTNGVQTVATVLAMRMAPESAGEAAGVITTAVALAVAAGPLLFSSVFKAFERTGYDGGVFLVVAVLVLSDLALCFWLPTDDHIAKCRARAAHEDVQKSPKGSVSTVAISDA